MGLEKASVEIAATTHELLLSCHRRFHTVLLSKNHVFIFYFLTKNRRILSSRDFKDPLSPKRAVSGKLLFVGRLVSDTYTSYLLT